MDSMIIIPSYKRADRLIDNIGTLRYISPKWRNRTVLYVRKEEAVDYVPVAAHYGVRLQAFEPSLVPFGWGHTMDAIVDDFSRYCDRFVTMDDDLDLTYRPDIKVAKYEKQNEYVFDKMMDDILCTNEDYPVSGILARQFSNNHKEEIETDTRIMQLFSFYSKVFVNRDDRRFSRQGPFYASDIYFVLNMLRQGYHNAVYCKYTRNDVPNTPGGCVAIGRNPKDHFESLKILKKAFPTILDVVEKTNTGNWEGGYMGTRIKWQHAFRERN